MVRFDRRAPGLVVMAALVAALCAPATVDAGHGNAGHQRFSVVAAGLHSPRGLAFGPGGILYLAQAGDADHAGSIAQIRNPSSRHPKLRTIIGGLPTIGDEGEFIGVDGISVSGRGHHTSIFAIMGLSPQATGNASFGNLMKVRLNGTATDVANVGSFDYQWTGDHSSLWQEFPDANPYAVLSTLGHVYVADAGANTLDEVHSDGSITVLAYFPNTALRDAIPTCIARGPDRALYIGILAFVDSAVLGPSAKVYRVDPSTANLSDPTATPMTEWATGLWPINGCAFGPNGSFYASQMWTNPSHDFNQIFADPRGDVVKIPWRSPSTHIFLTGGALSTTAGVAVSEDGAVFVADGTAFAPEGRVLRLAAHGEHEGD
jgi:hypothetical protein